MSKWGGISINAVHKNNATSREIAHSLLLSVMTRLGFRVEGNHYYEPNPNLKLVGEAHDSDLHVILGHELSLKSFAEADASHLAISAHRFLRRVRNSPFLGVACIFCILMILSPLLFEFGETNMDVPRFLLHFGLLTLIKKSLEDGATQKELQLSKDYV
ncbi:hypothetical protein N9967_01885 [bacterium]|nr:hypothetical protein [bacterium]MDB4681934.1 hypothetical protein [Akkermansiaceae bacterium]MDB4722673.1 hypothetical protein [Akkermansiaceae bacterium]